MNRRSVKALAVASVFALGWLVSQQITGTALAQENVTIPKSYGTFKGSDGGRFIFEDSNGVIRVVYAESGKLLQQISRR